MPWGDVLLRRLSSGGRGERQELAAPVRMVPGSWEWPPELGQSLEDLAQFSRGKLGRAGTDGRTDTTDVPLGNVG